MTPRQARRERREAERKSKKAAIKSAKGAAARHLSAKELARPLGGVLDTASALREFPRTEKADHFDQAPSAGPAQTREGFHGFVLQSRRGAHYESNGMAAEASHACGLDDFDELDGFVPQNPHPTPPVRSARRAEANRANAQLSTGPRTPGGKLASSRNSTKHGLASGQLIIPGESPADFEALLEDLVADHRPATPTEDLLVREMAQSYWLAQRALRLQNECFTAEGIDENRLSLFLRYQTTHDRAFYKALNALLRLKKDAARAARGFVSETTATPNPAATARESATPAKTELGGFVPQNPHHHPPNLSPEAKRRAA
jgi:hypothetical protein